MKKAEPFFSVVIPTFKRPLELNRAVNSVLKQTFSDFEIIIVNNSEEEVQLPFNDDRIRLLSEKKKGANYARNTGIENARAEFICFLDDDDEYLENHLEVLHRLILKNDKVVSLYRTFTRVENEKGEYKDQAVDLKDKNETALEHLYTTMLVMHCVCCHKNIFNNIKFDPSIPVAQDYHLWSRILSEYPLIEAPVITTIYRKTENSTSSPTKEKYLQYIKVYKNLFDINAIGSQLSRKIKSEKIFNYYFWLFCEFKNELSFKEHFKIIFKIIYYKPGILFGKELYAAILKST